MRILRIPTIMADFGYRSHASVYGAIHAGLLTYPVPTGQRSVGIPSDEVQAVIAARIRGDSDAQIRALVGKLHQARMEGSNEPFKPTWLDRSAEAKKQAAQRRKRTTLTKV